MSIEVRPRKLVETWVERFNAADAAILEWKDPLGLRGCGFFRIEQGRIAFQRGYWDKLSFLRLHDLPIE